MMLHAYVAAALLAAEYFIDSDGSTIVSIPLFSELTASGASFAACRQRLRKVVEAWIAAAVQTGEQLPSVYGIPAPSSLAEAGTWTGDTGLRR